MNKYILADMATEKLKREIGMVPKPLPEEIKILEKELPSGRMRQEAALYQAEKLKKITINKVAMGESTAGAVVIIVGEDEYDLPYTLVDIVFDYLEKGKVYLDFEAQPLVKDEESTRKYVDPFRKWRKAISNLPSEPGLSETGPWWKAHVSPTNYRSLIADKYIDEVMKFVDQFYDIFLDIYRKAEPVKNAQRRRKIDAFRAEFNQNMLGDDPSGQMMIEFFGQQTTELLYDYLINM